MAYLFLLKVTAGIAFGLFYKMPKYYATADTWRFYHLSLQETKWLLADPISFTKDLFTYGYSQTGNLFAGHNSYWNDLKSNVVIKLLAVCNVLTNNSYYANIILFNFLFFFGVIGLYRALFSVYPANKILLMAGVFLMPSALFWCSGIHKDGLILSATGLIIYYLHFGANAKTLTIYNYVFLGFCMLVIFALRNYVALALLPALLGWMLGMSWPKRSKYIFPLIYLSGILLFFLLPIIIPALNFPAFLSEKQHEFIALAGGSEVNVVPLKPTFAGYLNYLPSALDMAFFQPHISGAKSISSLLAFLEMSLFCLLTLLFVAFPKKKQTIPPLVWCFFYFSLSILIIAGYTITFSGAIVRYRSFVLPFVVAPLLCMIDFNTLQQKLGTAFRKSNG